MTNLIEDDNLIKKTLNSSKVVAMVGISSIKKSKVAEIVLVISLNNGFSS